MSVEPASEIERLFAKESKRLWRALVAYSGDREIASDAVGEAFAQALAGDRTSTRRSGGYGGGTGYCQGSSRFEAVVRW